MKYVLITNSGKVMAFNVLACAELYQTIYGGTLIRELLADAQPVTL